MQANAEWAGQRSRDVIPRAHKNGRLEYSSRPFLCALGMTSRERCPAHSAFACTAIDRGDGRESNLAAVPQHHAGADRQAGGEEKGRRPGTGKVAT